MDRDPIKDPSTTRVMLLIKWCYRNENKAICRAKIGVLEYGEKTEYDVQYRG